MAPSGNWGHKGHTTTWNEKPTPHRLRAWRKYHNVSLHNLSQLSGVSKAALSRVERYQQSPTIETVRRISNAVLALSQTPEYDRTWVEHLDSWEAP